MVRKLDRATFARHRGVELSIVHKVVRHGTKFRVGTARTTFFWDYPYRRPKRAPTPVCYPYSGLVILVQHRGVDT